MQYKFDQPVNPTRQVYQEFQDAYEFFNEQLFEGVLPRCLITLQRKKRTYGYFSTQRFVSRSGALTDEIAMNPEGFAVRSIEDVLSTLVHEMVHLWQQHFGEPGRARYHNGEWAERMEAIGLMPSHTGKPGGRRTGDQMSHYILDDGAFARACEHFLAQSPAITWLDRYPGELGEVGGELIGLMAAAGEKAGGSNRVKYSHTCLKGAVVNVWGKPGLSLDCGECGQNYNEVQ